MSIALPSLLIAIAPSPRLTSLHINRTDAAIVRACTDITVHLALVNRGIIMSMSSDDRQKSAPPAVTVTPAETATTQVSASDVLAVTQTNPPVLAEPQTLMEGL